MDILRRQYGTRRVHCNVVYQEYIRDKDHYHMNATRVSHHNLNYVLSSALIIKCCSLIASVNVILRTIT